MMKGMFSTFILSFVLMMVWSVRADSTNRPYYIDEYCSVNDLDCFAKCFNNTVSSENLNIFYSCLRNQTSATGSEEIQQFLCQTATQEQLNEFDDCVHQEIIQSVIFLLQFECCIYQSYFPVFSFICNIIG
ncbi:uncharacterized protein LOC111642562 isoform X3 [Centruroides sculpturatus]|nr:uncharacterized protein LOC111642562 isoform X2 [Centruroides sculpturatus]XP_023244686.1 uncharacterized protein LOC111642562 isoform X3 [Centruroides sculpturatus]